MQGTLREILIILVVCIGALVGMLVGSQFGREVLGAVAGAFIGFPLGLFLTRRQRRWLAIALLFVWFVLSYLAGGWQGAFYAIAASGLTFFVSAAILTELYGGGIFTALSSHLRLAMGLLRGFQIIRDGRSLVPSDATEVMGPRLIIVGPNNAVILERGPQQSRISGPGIFSSQQFEYVRAIYDLRVQQKPLTLKDVLTRDRVPTTVEACVAYRISLSDRARRGEIGLTDADIDIIRQLDTRSPDWEKITVTTIERCVRRLIARIDLDQLLTQIPMAQLEDIIRRNANTRIRTGGIHVDEVIIESVQPGEEVKAATAIRYIEIGRAEAMRDALISLAQGYRRARADGMTDEEIHREVLRSTIEQIARDPATKLYYVPGLNDLLSGLGN